MNKPMTRHPCDRKLYVGELGNNASKQELEDAFSYYGRIRCCWVARNPPGFAFVEFEDVRDAEDAARGLDGRVVCGRRIRVEQSSGRGGRTRGPPRGGRNGGMGGGPGGGGPGSGRPFHPEDRCYECGERGHYARDCEEYSRRGRGGSGGRRKERSRSRGGRRSRTRSRSRDRHSRSRSGGRAGSMDRRRYSRSRSRSPIHENGRNGL